MKCIGFVLLAGTLAAADTVRLRNGSAIEGKAILDGDNVIIEMDFGRMTVKKSDVVKITYDVSPLQELETKVAAAKADDADALHKLGVWARERDLEVRAKELFKKAIAVNPDHPGARGELGFRKFEGRWLSEEDWHAASGEVKYRGAWMKRADVERLQLAADESERRGRTDNKIADAHAELLQAQAELARAQAAAERTRVEIEKQAAQPVVRTVYVPVVAGSVHSHSVYGYSYQCCCGKGPAPAPPCPPIPQKK